MGIALLAVHSSLLAHFVIRQLQRSSRNAERFHRESSRRVKRLSDANERMERKVGDNAEALRTVKRSLNLTAQAVDAQRAVSTEIFVRTHGLAQPAPGRATAEADV
ncbi:hypothetical protein [Demequina mangrovi]|uniref:hypothetical protein n=1 Tax=Demequina mangrovi TaxID=1043493 RepID=UPI00115FFCD8|nr:hypothetical protein [Demequina mangrovi]